MSDPKPGERIPRYRLLPLRTQLPVEEEKRWIRKAALHLRSKRHMRSKRSQGRVSLPLHALDTTPQAAKLGPGSLCRRMTRATSTCPTLDEFKTECWCVRKKRPSKDPGERQPY